MDIEDKGFFSFFLHYCDLAVKRGWHPGAGGCLSMMIFPELILGIEAGLDFTGKFEPIPFQVPELSKEFLAVSSRSRFMDDMLARPDEFCGIIQIAPDGTGYRKVLGFEGGTEPSEDLPVHLLIHAKRFGKSGDRKSVVYHCHPAKLTALSYLLPLEDRAFSEAILRASFQCRKLLPEGVGVVKASEVDLGDLAEKTAKKMERFDAAVWAFHGLICTADCLPNVILITEVLERAAEMRILLMQMPGGVRQEPELELP